MIGVADPAGAVDVALPLLDALGERLDAGIHRGGPVQREGQPGEHLAERGQVLLDVLDQRGVDPRHVRAADVDALVGELEARSEEHTSELQSLMRISYAVFCLQKKKTPNDKYR